MKKVYFSGAIIRWSGDAVDMYPSIIEILKEYFHVLSEHINRWRPTFLTPQQVFARDTELIDESDIFIAEVSAPSHGVWREVAYAQFVRKIPVYLLYQQDKKISLMLLGNNMIPPENLCPWKDLTDIQTFCAAIA
jgi:hypothetical protein